MAGDQGSLAGDKLIEKALTAVAWLPARGDESDVEGQIDPEWGERPAEALKRGIAITGQEEGRAGEGGAARHRRVYGVGDGVVEGDGLGSTGGAAIAAAITSGMRRIAASSSTIGKPSAGVI